MKKILAFSSLFLLGVSEGHATWTPREVFDQLLAAGERKSEENDDNGDLRSPKDHLRAPQEPSGPEKELLEEQKRIQELYKQLEPHKKKPEWPGTEITPEKPQTDGDKK